MVAINHTGNVRKLMFMGFKMPSLEILKTTSKGSCVIISTIGTKIYNTYSTTQRYAIKQYSEPCIVCFGQSSQSGNMLSGYVLVGYTKESVTCSGDSSIDYQPITCQVEDNYGRKWWITIMSGWAKGSIYAGSTLLSTSNGNCAAFAQPSIVFNSEGWQFE